MLAEKHQALPVVDIFVGPVFSYRTPISANQDYCLVDVLIPDGVTVPLHSHADRETFYIVDGTLEGMLEGSWRTLEVGDVFDIVGGVRHALRNTSGRSMSLLMVTTMKLGQFFLDVGRAATANPTPPTPADMEHFLEVSQRYGYWMGDAADNKAVGISLN